MKPKFLSFFICFDHAIIKYAKEAKFYFTFLIFRKKLFTIN